MTSTRARSAAPSPKPSAKQPTAKVPAKKAAAKPTPKSPAKKAAAKPTAKKAPAKKLAQRADFGAPIDGFFAKQPAEMRPILEALRALVEAAAPDATASLKWGMPFYELAGATVCALGGHKAHVNLILSGPADAYADPEGRLAGTGNTGRHLKLTSLDELPTAAVRGWLRTAVSLARAKRA